MDFAAILALRRFSCRTFSCGRSAGLSVQLAVARGRDSCRVFLNSYARCFFLDGAKPCWAGWRWCSRKQRRSKKGATASLQRVVQQHPSSFLLPLLLHEDFLSRLLENPRERVRTGEGCICIHCISVWPAGMMKMEKLSKQYTSTGNLCSCFFFWRRLISLCSYSFWRPLNYF